VKVILSPTARASLIEIGDFIAQDSAVQARRFTAALRAKAVDIGKAPKLFPLARSSKIAASAAASSATI